MSFARQGSVSQANFMRQATIEEVFTIFLNSILFSYEFSSNWSCCCTVFLKYFARSIQLSLVCLSNPMVIRDLIIILKHHYFLDLWWKNQTGQMLLNLWWPCLSLLSLLDQAEESVEERSCIPRRKYIPLNLMVNSFWFLNEQASTSLVFKIYNFCGYFLVFTKISM